MGSGVYAKVPLNEQTTVYKFQFAIRFQGHGSLLFVPVGGQTSVTLSAPWGDPNFVGGFLPVQRDITKQSFSAQWKVIEANRNLPHYWLGENVSIFPDYFGVELFDSVGHYQKVTRLVKYAILFIGFTLVAFFLIEIIYRKRIKKMHPLQYLLVGAGLVLFYTLLLSFSEHMRFGFAYLLASAATVILITSYTANFLGKTAFIVGAVISVLYAYLYILLQLEDYALLVGSVGVFIILALVMYATRRIDWSAESD